MMNVATQINKEILGQIAAESIAKINPEQQNGRRWINAIAKAVVEIENNPFMTYEHTSHSLTMLSEQSGAVYVANGTCQCPAFEQGYPCYHRAASRLVAIYVERSGQ